MAVVDPGRSPRSAAVPLSRLHLRPCSAVGWFHEDAEAGASMQRGFSMNITCPLRRSPCTAWGGSRAGARITRSTPEAMAFCWRRNPQGAIRRNVVAVVLVLQASLGPACSLVEDVGHGHQLDRALDVQAIGGRPSAAASAADQGHPNRVVPGRVGATSDGQCAGGDYPSRAVPSSFQEAPSGADRRLVHARDPRFDRMLVRTLPLLPTR